MNNSAPVITEPTLSDAVAGETVTILLRAFDPGDDTITGWEVAWGDSGSFEALGASATEASHVYTDQGVFTITIRVYDEDSCASPAATITHQVTATINSVPNDGPYTIAEGEDLTVSATPFGTPDSIGWDINGGGNDIVGAGGVLTWNELQTLAGATINDSGIYQITLRAEYTDPMGDPLVITETVDVTVTNVAPTASFAPSGPVLEGSDGSDITIGFTDAFDPSSSDTAAGFTYDYLFGGDGSLDVLGSSSPSINVPAALLTMDGAFEVRGVVRDKDGDSTEYTTLVSVFEDPTQVVLGTLTPTIGEGAAFTLNAATFDQGNETHERIEIDWGDGEIEELADLAGPITHEYRDNGLFTIELAVWTDGVRSSSTLDVTVTNEDPVLGSIVFGDAGLSNSSTLLVEGAPAVLSGTLNDPGSEDTQTVTIDWGDGNTTVTMLRAGATEFAISHIYENDGVYDVTASLEDDDLGGSNQSTYQVTVANADPTIQLFTSLETILEGSSVTLSGVIDDPGAADTHNVTIDWGDGSPTTTLNGVSGAFEAIHTYSGDEAADADDQYEIMVMVTDAVDPASVISASTSLRVENIAPQFNEFDSPTATDPLTPAVVGQPVDVTGLFTEQGLSDTITVEVAWGDGTVSNAVLNYQTAEGGDFAASHTYSAGGAYELTVRVLDNDGGASEEVVTTVYVSGVEVPSVPGDFTRDTRVNAADYTVWRDQLGLVAMPYSGPDADGSGVVDTADYAAWVLYFGSSASPSAAPSVITELIDAEPVTIVSSVQAASSKGSQGANPVAESSAVRFDGVGSITVAPALADGDSEAIQSTASSPTTTRRPISASDTAFALLGSVSQQPSSLPADFQSTELDAEVTLDDLLLLTLVDDRHDNSEMNEKRDEAFLDHDSAKADDEVEVSLDESAWGAFPGAGSDW